MDTTHDHHGEDHDRGLPFDVTTMLARRRLLGLFAGAAGASVLAACGAAGASRSAGGTTATTAATATTSAASSTLAETPEETAGPYPADGSNGANVLTASGVVRSDIRSSFGSSTTTAAGVPLTIRMTERVFERGPAMRSPGHWCTDERLEMAHNVRVHQ